MITQSVSATRHRGRARFGRAASEWPSWTLARSEGAARLLLGALASAAILSPAKVEHVVRAFRSCVRRKKRMQPALQE